MAITAAKAITAPSPWAWPEYPMELCHFPQFRRGRGGYALSVYGKHFDSREATYVAALTDLKDRILNRVGSTDTNNDKQPVIPASLRAIEKAQLSRVQLSLF